MHIKHNGRCALTTPRNQSPNNTIAWVDNHYVFRVLDTVVRSIKRKLKGGDDAHSKLPNNTIQTDLRLS
jgi:hypothetical protein